MIHVRSRCSVGELQKYAFSLAKTYWIIEPLGTLILMHNQVTPHVFGRRLHQDNLLSESNANYTQYNYNDHSNVNQETHFVYLQ